MWGDGEKKSMHRSYVTMTMYTNLHLEGKVHLSVSVSNTLSEFTHPSAYAWFSL